MTGPSGITEHDLHAFADGELDAAARTEVEAWLAEHPDDAAHVHDLHRQREILHAAFDPVLDEAPPQALSAALEGAGRARPMLLWLTRAAAAIALFAVGLGAGWVLRGPGAPDASGEFLDMAVSAHVVHVAEKRHAVEVQAKEERHLVAWLSKRLEHPIKAPVLVKEGYRLVGGRLVADAGSPAAQFMYENAAGQRITLYTRRARETGEVAFHFATHGGVSAFYWIEAPLALALVGAMDRDALMPLARRIYKQFEP